MGGFLSRLSEQQKKMLGWLALAAVIGVGALILQPAPKDPAPLPEIPPQALGADWQGKWESELRAILDALLGERCSEVFLTLEQGASLDIAYSVTEEERSSAAQDFESRRTSTPIILRDDGMRKETPLILKKRQPTVRGVLVVLRRSPDPGLRLRVAQAVQTALQAPMYRIEVLFKE
ncbi:MAG TPA: hypothetical protein GX528_03870 [Firmicutes bacterium]|nr:hypothetical protein [Bacillota bacterium]